MLGNKAAIAAIEIISSRGVPKLVTAVNPSKTLASNLSRQEAAKTLSSLPNIPKNIVTNIVKNIPEQMKTSASQATKLARRYVLDPAKEYQRELKNVMNENLEGNYKNAYHKALEKGLSQANAVRAGSGVAYTKAGVKVTQKLVEDHLKSLASDVITLGVSGTALGFAAAMLEESGVELPEIPLPAWFKETKMGQAVKNIANKNILKQLARRHEPLTSESKENEGIISRSAVSALSNKLQEKILASEIEIIEKLPQTIMDTAQELISTAKQVPEDTAKGAVIKLGSGKKVENLLNLPDKYLLNSSLYKGVFWISCSLGNKLARQTRKIVRQKEVKKESNNLIDIDSVSRIASNFATKEVECQEVNNSTRSFTEIEKGKKDNNRKRKKEIL